MGGLKNEGCWTKITVWMDGWIDGLFVTPPPRDARQTMQPVFTKHGFKPTLQEGFLTNTHFLSFGCNG